MSFDHVRLTPEIREKLIADGSIEYPSSFSEKSEYYSAARRPRTLRSSEEKLAIIEKAQAISDSEGISLKAACEQIDVAYPSYIKWVQDRNAGKL